MTALAYGLLTTSASAQTYTVQIQNGRPDLGRVVSSATESVFRIAASGGAVTRISGMAVRLDGGSAPTMVTISCGNTNSCNTRDVNLKLGGLNTSTGRAGPITNFTISMGTAVLESPPTGTDPVSFVLQPIGKNGSKTFWVGADVPIRGAGGGTTGAASSSFYVYARRYNDTPTTGDTGQAEATVYRPVTLSKQSDLQFGGVIRPLSGNGRVEINPTTGQRELTNVVGRPTPSPAPASYIVQGEGGRSVSIDVPAQFTMTGPNGALTVTTTSTAGVTTLLNSTLGTSGEYAFDVGGWFPLSPSTPSGAYSGAFNVTVAYN